MVKICLSVDFAAAETEARKEPVTGNGGHTLERATSISMGGL